MIGKEQEEHLIYRGGFVGRFREILQAFFFEKYRLSNLKWMKPYRKLRTLKGCDNIVWGNAPIFP